MLNIIHNHSKSEPRARQTVGKQIWNNPPILWSGVLDHFEAKGGCFLPLLPCALHDLLGHWQNLDPFGSNCPNLDPFGSNGPQSNRNPATQLH